MGTRPRLKLFAALDAIFLDLRYSIRVLASHRAFAGLSVLCLGLAIGTNTTVFTFVNGLLLRPLPLASAERLVSIHETRREDPHGSGPVSYPNFLDWRERGSGVVEMAAARSIGVRVSEGEEPERHPGALVSWNFFAVLGVRPAAGRSFLEEEDRRGGPEVVLLSHHFWQERYGGNPAVVGRAVTVNGVPHTVVGVMPDELSHLALPNLVRSSRLWIPIGSAEDGSPRDQRRLTVVARLGDGVTQEAARARVGEIARALEREYPVENDGWVASLQPLRVGFSPRTRAMIVVMMGAVAFVLLIACANVANLTLARVTGRRRELAVRRALGAPRRRIVGQMVAESLLVAVASVPLGIAVGYGGRNLILSGQASPELLASFSIDTQVLFFTIGLALLASLLSGLLPALHAVRRVRHHSLQAGGHRDLVSGQPHRRLARALIVGEVALALILLVGASLFLRSFRNLLTEDGGFDTSPILAITVEGAEDANGIRVDEIVDRLQALPGVTHAAAANLMPLRDAGVRTAVVPDGSGTQAPEASVPPVLLGGVTPRFFGVLNVPIRQGRMFTDVESRSRSPVAVVNQTMARRFWPDQDAIGRRFRRATDEESAWFTIVGVSGDILTWDLSNRPLPTAYLPHSHVPDRDPRLFIRAPGDPSLLASPARAAIRSVDPTLLIGDVRTMTEVHYLALSRNQTLASLFAALGAIGLVLGATGVYGVLSYFVSQRTYEIGIRAALGADRRTVVRLFVRQGMTMTLVGVGIGLAGAWALARLVRGSLHEVSASDPLSFAGTALLLTAVGFLATWVPARRAAAVDPLVAIRD